MEEEKKRRKRKKRRRERRKKKKKRRRREKMSFIKKSVLILYCAFMFIYLFVIEVRPFSSIFYFIMISYLNLIIRPPRQRGHP